MLKQNYMKPAIRVVKIQQRSCLLNNSGVYKNSNNVNLNENIRGGSVSARARQHSVWDDE